MRDNIATIKYKPANGASPASFKLELRQIAKRRCSDLYFKSAKNAKNIGCILFGQKDTWKGLFAMNFEEPNRGYSYIEIMLDIYRGTAEEIRDAKKLLINALRDIEQEPYCKELEECI
jgi:hypothetical protein